MEDDGDTTGDIGSDTGFEGGFTFCSTDVLSGLSGVDAGDAAGDGEVSGEPDGCFVSLCVEVRCDVPNGDCIRSSLVTDFPSEAGSDVEVGAFNGVAIDSGALPASVVVDGLATGVEDRLVDIAGMPSVALASAGASEGAFLVVIEGAEPDELVPELNSRVCERCAVTLSSSWRLSGLADA